VAAYEAAKHLSGIVVLYSNSINKLKAEILKPEFQPDRRLEGVVFDFNGVLWWDNALQEQAWRDFSADFRGYALSDEEMAVHVHGRNNHHTLSYLSGRALSAQEAAQLSEKKEAGYQRLCLEQGQAFRLSTGAISLLDFLVSKNIPHTIATASGKANVDFFIKHLELARWFDTQLIVYDDGSMAGKPAPDYFLAAAGKLGLDARSCIVIEDSLSGLQGAQAAGIGYVYALLGDSGHALRGHVPSGVMAVNDLSEIDRSLLFR
jgi:beta-phosphoglucomutase-like phosphatase (HAD superfamily)